MQTIEFNQDELDALLTAVALRKIGLTEIRDREKESEKTVLFSEVSKLLDSLKSIDKKLRVAREKEWNNA